MTIRSEQLHVANIVKERLWRLSLRCAKWSLCGADQRLHPCRPSCVPKCRCERGYDEWVLASGNRVAMECVGRRGSILPASWPSVTATFALSHLAIVTCKRGRLNIYHQLLRPRYLGCTSAVDKRRNVQPINTQRTLRRTKAREFLSIFRRLK